MDLEEFLLSFLIAFALIVMVRGMAPRGQYSHDDYVPENAYNPNHHPYIPGVPTPTPKPSHHGGHHSGKHHGGHHGGSSKHHHGKHHGGHPSHDNGGSVPQGATYGEYIPYGQPVNAN